jgi:hypothetical protein
MLALGVNNNHIIAIAVDAGYEDEAVAEGCGAPDGEDF